MFGCDTCMTCSHTAVIMTTILVFRDTLRPRPFPADPVHQRSMINIVFTCLNKNRLLLKSKQASSGEILTHTTHAQSQLNPKSTYTLTLTQTYTDTHNTHTHTHTHIYIYIYIYISINQSNHFIVLKKDMYFTTHDPI